MKVFNMVLVARYLWGMPMESQALYYPYLSMIYDFLPLEKSGRNVFK